ncbi:MAG: TonB family protein [Elusimicrobiota bacterium]
MNVYLIYSGIIHATILLFLTLISFPNLKSGKKQYYIDFIGKSEIITTQNYYSEQKTNNTETQNPIKPEIKNDEIKSKTEKDQQIEDSDYLYTNVKGIKPSMADEESQILKSNSKNLSDNVTKSNDFKQQGIRTDSNFPYSWYITKLRARIWDSWQLQEVNSKNLKAVVKFKITSSGNIVAISIDKSSGNRLFDQSVVMAISEIKKFDPLPEDFYENYLTVYVEFKTFD